MPTPTGYSRTQIILHWVAVLLIAQQYVFGDAIGHAWRSFKDGQEIAFNPLILAHVAGGAVVLLLTLWRLSLKAKLGIPAEIGDNALQNLIAKVTKLALYGLMLLMPISGSLAWFGNVDIAATAHNVLKVLLMALMALHVLGALFHQFVLKDNLMDRMRTPR